jgi:predicted subunit of tRNA(5-methylaminomethyl-2-thiouridylate) methyltransferase
MIFQGAKDAAAWVSLAASVLAALAYIAKRPAISFPIAEQFRYAKRAERKTIKPNNGDLAG